MMDHIVDECPCDRNPDCKRCGGLGLIITDVENKMDRYEILFWHKVNDVLTLERKISRDRIQPCVHMLDYYCGKRGICGVALYCNKELVRYNGECGEYDDCPVFVPKDK